MLGLHYSLRSTEYHVGLVCAKNNANTFKYILTRVLCYNYGKKIAFIYRIVQCIRHHTLGLVMLIDVCKHHVRKFPSSIPVGIGTNIISCWLILASRPASPMFIAACMDTSRKGILKRMLSSKSLASSSRISALQYIIVSNVRPVITIRGYAETNS